jgi:hypothetical protein
LAIRHFPFAPRVVADLTAPVEIQLCEQRSRDRQIDALTVVGGRPGG